MSENTDPLSSPSDMCILHAGKGYTCFSGVDAERADREKGVKIENNWVKGYPSRYYQIEF